MAQARVTDCALCQAKDAQIVRLLSRRDTIDHARAKARVVELEETIARTNRSQPLRAAVEVCRQLAGMDPRDQTSMACLFCCSDLGDRIEPKSKHRPECFWVAAVELVKATDRRAS